MEEVGVGTWQEELASLVDSGQRYDGNRMSSLDFGAIKPEMSVESENFKELVTGLLSSWGEMLLDLGRGCRDIVQQTVVTENSFVVQKLGRPAAKVSRKLSFLNEYLPEDRDPIHVWPVIFFVSLLALAALSFNPENGRPVPPVKLIREHPPGANRIPLPDGRNLSYQELGVPADRARYSILAPHSFLSSRLAGIPGMKMSLLEEFGVRLVTYDLPGFGESDPHPSRSLNSSAYDILFLADAVAVNEKFWVLGYSSGAKHVWAALRYIPERIAGAAMLAPMINPYEPSMTKEEMAKTWEHWLPKRKYMYFLARRLPNLLSYFYRQTFLSGKHGEVDQWISASLGYKDNLVVKDSVFEEFWHRDVEESVRQGSAKPFIEEAVLEVSDWGFGLSEFHIRKKCYTKGILSWLKSIYSEAECELIGFPGPIHVWQGTDDKVVPPSVADYISRVLPEAVVHKLPNEGHFSYFYFCDDCHRQILLTLFGSPQGPLDKPVHAIESPTETDIESARNTSTTD